MYKKIKIFMLVLFVLMITPSVFAATTVNTKEQFKTALMDSTIDVVKLGADIEITNDDRNNTYYFKLKEVDRTLDLNGHNLIITKSLGSEYGIEAIIQNL